MQIPYEVLGVDVNANDVEIKQAYLQQVKNNPPDRDNEKFQAIHDAYSSIKDKSSRLKRELFNLPADDFDMVIDAILATEQDLVIDSVVLQQIVMASVDDNLLNTITSPKK